MASRLPVDAPEGTAARPMTPDSSRTSASTVGLPRESSISLAMTSTIALIALPDDLLFSLLQQVFRARPALHQAVQVLQRLQERLHEGERPRVGTVGEGFGGVWMGFHEYAGDAARDGRPGEHRHEFALAPAGGALPPRLLHRVGGIEDHRAAGVAHDHERAHVRDE